MRRSAGLVSGCTAPGSDLPLINGPRRRQCGAGRQFPAQRLHFVRIAQIDSARITAVCVQRRGNRQLRVRKALEPLQLRDGIADDFRDRHFLVHEAIHEGGIGAVLQKTADQVRQQVLVLTHRRIHAHARKIRNLARRLRVEKAAHAMQTLEFEVRRFRREFQYGGNAVGIVRCELRVQHIGMLEDSPGAGQIGNIRGDLARVHRIAVEAAFLAALDFRVPISTLDQAHRHLPAMAASRRGNPVDHIQRPLAVGLNRQPQARPVARRGIPRQRFDDVE